VAGLITAVIVALNAIGIIRVMEEEVAITEGLAMSLLIPQPPNIAVAAPFILVAVPVTVSVLQGRVIA